MAVGGVFFATEEGEAEVFGAALETVDGFAEVGLAGHAAVEDAAFGIAAVVFAGRPPTTSPR